MAAWIKYDRTRLTLLCKVMWHSPCPVKFGAACGALDTNREHGMLGHSTETCQLQGVSRHPDSHLKGTPCLGVNGPPGHQVQTCNSQKIGCERPARLSQYNLHNLPTTKTSTSQGRQSHLVNNGRQGKVAVPHKVAHMSRIEHPDLCCVDLTPATRPSA